LEGNQLAVVTDGRGIDEQSMQRIALELKLSETVFLLPALGEADVRVRIFTPTVELPFAGHPILGSAAVVARALERSSVLIETGAGPVRVAVEPGAPRTVSGRMSQPVPSWEPFDRGPELLAALGLQRSGLPIEVYCNGPRHIYVELDSPEAVGGLRPDIEAVGRVGGEVGVSCFAGKDGSYKSRMFAPGMGVPEDPATGSAAGPLAVHLARHGRIAFGSEIEISQGAEIGRPSRLLALAVGSVERVEAVQVAGQALLLGRGRLWLD
jgi:trans-2,3-dihydro-3-hydroxyanthranilate isomerase